jgi:hypothetical protein
MISADVIVSSYYLPSGRGTRTHTKPWCVTCYDGCSAATARFESREEADDLIYELTGVKL